MANRTAVSFTITGLSIPNGATFYIRWLSFDAAACEDPVFTPTTPGVHTFTVTVPNNYGSTTTCNITICVLDIRVEGTDGKKVYLCHATWGNAAMDKHWQ